MSHTESSANKMQTSTGMVLRLLYLTICKHQRLVLHQHCLALLCPWYQCQNCDALSLYHSYPYLQWKMQYQDTIIQMPLALCCRDILCSYAIKFVT